MLDETLSCTCDERTLDSHVCTFCACAECGKTHCECGEEEEEQL